jgi:hypothetical protein
MTKTAICNLALSKLGALPIVSTGENTVNAEHLRTHYDAVLAEVLRKAPWSFAIARALAPGLDAPAWGWSKAYQIPFGCIHILEVNSYSTEDSVDPPFEIEGGKILCDADSCRVRYVKLEEDTSTYPGDFTELFATMLAARICPGITGDSGKAAQLEGHALSYLLPNAIQQGVNESRPYRVDLVAQSDLVRSRYQ